MTDHKFTDDEIIKALECCMKTERAKDCELMKCPACYKDGCIYFDRADSYDEYSVYKELTKDALALINRQKAMIESLNAIHADALESLRLAAEANKDMQAEIKRLQSQVNRLKQYDEERDIRLHARLTANARADGITEFAREHREIMLAFCDDDDQISLKVCEYDANTNNLVKEMTEK